MTIANIEDLETKKVSSILWQYALPAIVGIIVNMVYNIIDAIFIGQWVGKDAIIALGVVFPLMNLTAAFGMLVGIGAASQISLFLGIRDKQTAEHVAGTALLLNIILTSFIVAILLVFLKPVLVAAGANEATYPYARDFMLIYLPGNIFLSICYSFNNIMRSTGYPLKAMYTMMIGVVANILLAPLFIHVFGWGIRGAALATILSMFISACFVMHHFLDKTSFIKLRRKNINLDKRIITSILSIGLSPFFIQIATCLLIFFVNYQLKIYGDRNSDDIGAYIIVSRILMLIITIVIGLTQGMQPIVGYNYGANNLKRTKEVLVYTIQIATCITTVGFLVGLFIPGLCVSIFTTDPDITRLATTAFRLMVLSFPVVAFQIVVTNFFQSIGMAKKAIFLSLSRQFLLLAPALYFLPQIWGLNGIWLAMPISDVIATVIALYLYQVEIRSYRSYL